MELIKINTKPDGTTAVSANELYSVLGLAPQHWAKWYKKNITNNEFAVENEDFTELPFEGRTKDFALSIDFAKKLSMLTRTEKGEKVRNHFIECEKKLQQIQAPKQLSRAEILGMAVVELQNMNEELTEAVNKANTTISIQAPKVEYYDKVISSTGTYNTNLIAKELGTSAISLNRQLKEMGVQYAQCGTWVLTAKYQDKEYTKTKTHTFQSATGEIKTSMLTVWTEKGRRFLHGILFKHGSDKALSLKYTA